MTNNLTELKDEPLGLAPTSADFSVPGTSFIELKDEPLGKHPIHAAIGINVPDSKAPLNGQAKCQRVLGAAADDESVFKFDVDALGDEALDHGRALAALAACGRPCAAPICHPPCRNDGSNIFAG